MRFNGRLGVVCLLTLGLLAGCSHPTSTSQTLFTEKYGDFAYCEMRVVKQAQSNSCGIASLVALLNYWGVDTTEQQLLEEFTDLRKEGFSMIALQAIAKSKGLQAYAFTMNPEPVEKLTEQIYKGRPLICIVTMPKALYFAYDMPLFGDVYRELMWMMGPRKNHFFVVFGNKDKEFLIMDPAFGFTTFRKSHLADAWGEQKNLVLLCARSSEKPD